MEHIFETVYPEYKLFKQNIFYITQEFLYHVLNGDSILIYFSKDFHKIINKLKSEKINERGVTYKYYINFNNIKYNVHLKNTAHLVKYLKEDWIKTNTSIYYIRIKRNILKDFLKENYSDNFQILKKINDKYIDSYGNEHNLNSMNLIQNLDLRFNNSYISFFMKQKYPNINIATFYDDNTYLIERTKEQYYSLSKIKKENEEKNKFEEIQKELKELKDKLKIKDEEISKIKDDLDILKKILTKL